MSNFSNKDYKEENRKLREDIFRRTEQLTNALNLIENTYEKVKGFTGIEVELKKFLSGVEYERKD